jgi:hypothetical protein
VHVVSGEGWHISSDEGLDVAKQADEPGWDADAHMLAILEIVMGVISQENTTPSPGLDPRLNNFAGNGQAVYIDLVPPLIREAGTTYVHHPNPTDPDRVRSEYVRKFTPEGILQRLRFEFLAVDPKLATKFEKHALSFLPSMLRGRITTYFAQLPDNRIPYLNTEGCARMLDDFTGSEVDEMRAFAARLIPDGVADRKGWMQKVFILTSSYPTAGYPLTQAERMAMLRTMLKEECLFVGRPQ